MEIQRRRRARRTAAQWAEVVAAYRRSGQTQTAFARSRGVGEAALRNWLYRDRSPAPRSARGAGGFVPVRLIGEGRSGGVGDVPGGRPVLVVRWPQGASVELHVDPAAPGVAELVRSLIGQCSR
jgi:hypothetical protein